MAESLCARLPFPQRTHVTEDATHSICVWRGGAGPLPSGGGWAFEFKYDGVRAITYVDGGNVRVLSRNGNDVTATYPELGALGDLPGDRSAILDGEIVALEAGERQSFAKLAARMHVALPTPALLQTVPVVYYVFDLLWLDGKPLVDEPYDRRGQLLAELALDVPAVRTPPHLTTHRRAPLPRNASRETADQMYPVTEAVSLCLPRLRRVSVILLYSLGR